MTRPRHATPTDSLPAGSLGAECNGAEEPSAARRLWEVGQSRSVNQRWSDGVLRLPHGTTDLSLRSSPPMLPRSAQDDREEEHYLPEKSRTNSRNSVSFKSLTTLKAILPSD